MTEDSRVKQERNGDGKSEEEEKKRCSQKEINDSLCESNIKAGVEEHVLSGKKPRFCVDDHDEIAIVIPSINKTVSTNYRSNKLFKK